MSKYQVSRRAQGARWLVRALMIVVILFLAVQRGSGGGELLALGAIVLGALLLPVVLTWCWRRTEAWAHWQRITVTLAVAVGLLFGFALAVKSLVA